MLSNVSDQIRNCYDQAEEARRQADATVDPAFKASLLEMETRWLMLARSYGFSESLGEFMKESKRRQRIGRAALSSRFLDALATQGADLIERSKSEKRLRESEERYLAFVTASSDVVYRMSPDWSQMHYLRGTDFIADTERPGHRWLEKYIHPDDQTRVMTAIHEAILSKSTFELKHPVIRVDGTIGWAHSRAIPLFGEEGEIVEWLGAMRDITEHHDWEAELQHRTRNLIGVVRWIAERTARASADLADFRGRFRERLDALARVQGLLSRQNERDRITFDDLIRSEMSAIQDGADRITLLGPSGVHLRSSTLQMLAIALHELAANAVKYGALAQPSGRLAVGWRFELSGEDGKPWLHVDWREQGVEISKVGAMPRGSGLGRELIEQALPYQLKAKTSYALEPDGVHCTISVPVLTSSEKVSVRG